MSFLSTSQCPPHPAGSNKRQYNVCATCLSLGWDDKLHPFSEELMIILKHLLYDFDLDGCLRLVPPENGIGLCDLCLKTLQDIYFFKQTALNSLSHLKKQREYCFQRTQTEQNTSQYLPEDPLVVTTKVEIKEEPDPLETPKLIVFSHTTPEANELVDIKEESHIENDHTNAESNVSVNIKDESHIHNDYTNAESNSDTELADSENLDDDIKSSIPKTVNFGTDVNEANSGSEYRNTIAVIEKANSKRLRSGNKRKSIIKKNIKSNSIQNTMTPLVRIAPKPDPSFTLTSHSSYVPDFMQETLSTLNVGPSALPVPTSQLPVPTSQLPVTTSQLPVTTSQLPVPTSQLPVTTSQHPVTASQLPVPTSQLPVTTSQLPVPTSQLPVTTSQLPVTTSQHPVFASQHPVTASQLPVPTSQLPVTTSQLPVPTSQHPVTTSQAQVRRNTAAKEQSDTQISCDRPCSDTDSDSGAGDKKCKKKYRMPWYITVLTREQLVKIREDLLKDPCFVDAIYKCFYCAQTFNSKDNLSQHKGHCHGSSKEKAEFSCFVCGLRFDTLSLLSAHMGYHSAGHHTYQCSTCDYTTKDTHFVNRHRCPNKGGEKVPPRDPTMKLASGRRQYYCPACEFVSYKVVHAHYHRFHTNAGPVKCDVCDKTMKNLDSLQQHKKRHKQRPEKREVMFCAPCLKPFYNMSAYREHMKTVKHAPKDQVKISCDECPKKFHLQELYEKHKRSHELVRNNTKPHKCTQCGLSYVFKTTLSAHIRTKHTEREIKRGHICEVCGDAFTNGSILRAHMARHSDERPYKCEYCGDTFKYSGARYTHIKLKHKKKTKPDDQNKGIRKSARNRTRRKEKGNEHEQSEDTREHEQEQSVESSVYGGNMESLEDYDLEMQNIEKNMEV